MLWFNLEISATATIQIKTRFSKLFTKEISEEVKCLTEGWETKSEGLLVFNTDIVMYNKSSSPEPHSFMHLQLNNIELSYLSFKLFYSYPAFVQKGTFMINVLSNTVKEYLSQYPHLRRSELTSAAKLPQPLQTSTAIPAV